MQLSIKNNDQLRALLHSNKKVDFIFELPMLSNTENEQWQQKIKQHYFACGCSTGKLFMQYAFVLASAGLLFMYIAKGSAPSITMYVYAVLFIFLMAGIGKALGKNMAYEKLKKDIHELQYILYTQYCLEVDLLY